MRPVRPTATLPLPLLLWLLAVTTAHGQPTEEGAPPPSATPPASEGTAPAKPGDAADPPAETGGETKPAETGGETEPAETGGETKPAETGGEAKPAETGGETKPAETGGETEPAETGGSERTPSAGDPVPAPPAGPPTAAGTPATGSPAGGANVANAEPPPPAPSSGAPVAATPTGRDPAESPTPAAGSSSASNATKRSAQSAGPGAPGKSAEADADEPSDKGEGSQANLAAQGVIGASGDGGRLLYRLSMPWGHSVTWPTLFPNLARSYNPTYSWSFTPNIVWFATQRTWFFASQGLNVELTDADGTTERQQLLLSDFSTGIQHQLAVVPVTDGHLAIWSVGSNAFFPVSKASQAATRILGLDGRSSLAWIFTDVLSSLIVQASTRFRVNPSQSKVAVLPNARFLCTPLNGTADVPCYTGVNANSLWAWNLGLGSQLIALPNLFITLNLGFTTRRIYGFDPADFRPDSGGVLSVPARGARQFASYSASLSVSYLPLPMMSLSVTFSDILSQRGPDNEPRGLFDAQDLFLDFVVSVFLDGTEDPPDP